jgi:hypothetical protein
VHSLSGRTLLLLYDGECSFSLDQTVKRNTQVQNKPNPLTNDPTNKKKKKKKNDPTNHSPLTTRLQIVGHDLLKAAPRTPERGRSGAAAKFLQIHRLSSSREGLFYASAARSALPSTYAPPSLPNVIKRSDTY